MKYNYTTSQAPDKGVQVGPEPIPTPDAILAMTRSDEVQVGPEPIPTPDAILAMTQDSNPGFGGNFVEVGIVTNGNKRAVYMSKAYPANVDGTQRPGATVEYSSEFSVGRGIGGGTATSILPSGYIAAEFLEFGTTDKYIEVTTPWTPAGARVEVRAYERFYNITPSGSNSEIGNGSSGNYFFWGAKNGKWHVGCGNYNTTTYTADTNWHNMRLVYAPDGGCWVDDLKVRGCDFNASRTILRNFRLGATTPTVNNIYYSACTQIKTVSLRVDGKIWRDVHAAIDPLGKPCVYDRIEKETFYNGTTTAELTVGLTLAQARQLRQLPAGGGTLKVSLPSNYLEDAGVANAIAAAKANSWNIEVVSTFEADSTSSTFDLRRIWVRKTQNEQGNYIDSDGARWQVESCIAMYNADGSEPDAHGYEPYRSVEAAVSYWELEPYVYPDEKELS